MCGIAGIFTQTGRPAHLRIVEGMVRVQAHRGPDGRGYVLIDPSGKDKPISFAGELAGPPGAASQRHSLALGHCRLAILDLSPLGHQPMASEDGRDWVTYNGEIYNYLELRDELRAKGYRFRSNSDTEVLLAAYRAWGEDCVARFNGMFAFALWDGDRRQLFCARDRLGEKPFYYRWDGQQFTFASEIKSILATHQGGPPNHRAILEYLQHGALDHSERTFFEGIFQLLPAHVLVVRDGVVETKRYWDLPVSAQGQGVSIKEEAARFLELMRESVRVRLRSDVPIGSCLSGGLDSSSIVCLASESGNGGARFKTFSSCFEDPAYDERRFITPVLERTGAEAYYAFPDPTELAEKIERLVWQQDEPFGSTSIFAQWNVMRLASQNGLKVILDGQGADELLAGYQGFFGAFFADLLKEGKGGTLLRELRAYRRLYGAPSRYALATIARALLPTRLVGFVRDRVTGSPSWLDPDFRSQYGAVSTSAGESGPHVQGLQRALLTGNGLRALLHYEDRNSMAFGIEARLPYLDFRLVEFLYDLDTRFKISQGWTKAVLREAMKGILPEAVRCRVDKMGFVTPEDQWFRTTLCEPAREILADPRCRSRGYLNVNVALHTFDKHVAGRVNIGNTIWRWLNVELWSRHFLDQHPCAELVS